MEVIQSKTEVSPTFDQSGSPILEGTRNNTLFREGCALRGTGADVNQIKEILVKKNVEQCLPPLDSEEVNQIAASAAEYEPGKATSLAPSKKSPLWWFKFDVNEWCTDPRVLAMIDYHRGWYISLLAACWKSSGFLPSDPEKLARIARPEDRDRFKAEIAEVLWEFELCEDGVQIVHSRLNAEWRDKVAEVERNKAAGQSSAKKRQRSRTEEAA